MQFFRNLLKYIFDLVVALMLLIPAVLFSIVIGMIIKFDSKGPVFYRQKRYGRNNKPFMMYKFRTMIVGADKQQTALQSKNEASGFLFKMATDPRQTNVGRSLRGTGLDEIPQIFNVLKGEMSLVGPRPLPTSDVDFSKLQVQPDLYQKWEIRMKARPGITGLWQVNPGDHSFANMLELDEKYVENFSLVTDFEIIVRTAQMALSGIFPKLIRNPKNDPGINKKFQTVNKK
ncbi:MAG: sugar transferase [Patescibacteria group bacterium]